MKRILKNVKKCIKFGKAQRLAEAAGTTAFVLLMMIIFHSFISVAIHLSYYALVSLMILSMWGRAIEETRYA